jgi:hypothetical protein
MKVILTVLSGGDSAITYFDAQTGLIAGMRAIRHAGQTADSSTFMLFGDYKRIDGAMIPMKHTIFVRDQQIVTRIVEYDHKRIDPARFVLPPAIRGLMALPPNRRQ